MKGWLVTIDLAAEKPLAERSHVFGPLYDVPDPRSFVSFDAGANFTEGDASAAAATPTCCSRDRRAARGSGWAT